MFRTPARARREARSASFRRESRLMCAASAERTELRDPHRDGSAPPSFDRPAFRSGRRDPTTM
jgi:hypothetical protein